MSYYDYDPNSNYYYDEFHQYPESDVSYDDPNYIDQHQMSQQKRFAHANGSYMSNRSYISSTRNSLHNYYIVSQESIPDDNQYTMPHYVVPVVYAPSKIVGLASSGLKELKDRSMSHESIDQYYSNKRNIDREAAIYQKLMQRRYPREIIPEEPESTTSASESIQFSEKEKSETEVSDKTQLPSKLLKQQGKRYCEMCIKAKEIPSKVKKKVDNEEKMTTKDEKPTILEESVNIKLEEINEGRLKHTSQIGGNQALSKSIHNEMCKEQVPRKEKVAKKAVTKKVFLSHISHMPISCIPSTSDYKVKDNATGNGLDIGHVKLPGSPQKAKTEKAVGSNRREESKLEYYSVSDISQCIQETHDKSKLIGWRNKSKSEESTNNTSSLPSDTINISNVASKNSESTTDSVTIDTQEYEEFIASIIEKPAIPNEIKDNSKSQFVSKLFNRSFKLEKSDQSLDFKYDIDNSPVSISVTPKSISTTMSPVNHHGRFENEDQTEIEVKTTVSVSKSLTEAEKHGGTSKQPMRAPKLEMTKDSLECSRAKMYKSNPLLEAPLIMSSKSLFGSETRDEVNKDSRVIRDGHLIYEDTDDSVSKASMKKTLFMKVIRLLGNFITSVQNISYRYILRYILFI